MDMKVSSTIGYERPHNPLLREADVERFVERSLATLGPQPPNFQAIVALNRGPLLGVGVEATPLTPRQVELKSREGALVVDVRTDQQFDEAHVPGAVCITAQRGLRVAPGVDRRPRAGDTARRSRRRRRAERREARHGGGDPAAGGLPARPDDELTRGGPAGRDRRAPADRRARGALRRRRGRRAADP
jgi:rhodanese-related sulfurtransferase